MGQPLVHPQRLGFLVGVFSCTLVRDEQGLVVHFQSSASCWGLLDWACSHGLVSLAGLCASYKMDINNTCCHGFLFLMDFY